MAASCAWYMASALDRSARIFFVVFHKCFLRGNIIHAPERRVYSRPASVDDCFDQSTKSEHAEASCEGCCFLPCWRTSRSLRNYTRSRYRCDEYQQPAVMRQVLPL